jgi:hypothetical protein
MPDNAYHDTLPVPPNTICNVRYVGDEDHGFGKLYIPMVEIAKTLYELTGGWPKRVGPNLFVDYGERGLRYLPTPEALFSWLKEQIDVCWDNECLHPLSLHPMTPVTAREFFIFLQNSVEDFVSLEAVPHWPPIKKPPVYYLQPDLPEPDMTALEEYMDHFNAETDDDRLIALAAAVTPAWGGPPGCRPAFVFTSKHGYGVGKTESANLIASIWGGAVELNEYDSWDKIQKAVMNDEMIGRRCMLFDNVKSQMSHSGLESLVTAGEVSGHIMWQGYRKRLNFFTVFVTANSAQLSRDLTDRAVVVNLGKPSYDANWKEWSIYFLRERKQQFISDALFFLASPPQCEIPDHALDRWASWERAVLSQFSKGARLIDRIKQTRALINADLKLAEKVAATLCNVIADRECGSPDTVQLKLSDNEVVSALQQASVFTKKQADMGVVPRKLRDLLPLAPLRRLTEEEGSWVWTGPEYQQARTTVGPESAPPDTHPNESPASE